MKSTSINGDMYRAKMEAVRSLGVLLVGLGLGTKITGVWSQFADASDFIWRMEDRT